MKKITGFIAILFLLGKSAFSLNVPALTAHVNDYAGIMNQNDKYQAESYLSSLEQTTGIQIAVLTINSLDTESLESYSMKVCETWKLGQKDKDNGALLLVSLQDRKVRIETGYGLEDKLTDVKCGLIIRNVILPEFRNGDYSEGILKAVKNMGGIASDNAELISKSVQEEETSSGTESALFGILFVFGWFIVFSCLASGRRNHWLPWIIFSSAFRNSYTTTSRSYHSSGFSGGHSGFSGGGGHFGGGGASGGW